MVAPEAYLGEEEVARRRDEVPLELVGIDAAYTPAVQTSLDRLLGLDGGRAAAAPDGRRTPSLIGVGGAAPEGVEGGDGAA